MSANGSVISLEWSTRPANRSRRSIGGTYGCEKTPLQTATKSQRTRVSRAGPSRLRSVSSNGDDARSACQGARDTLHTSVASRSNGANPKCLRYFRALVDEEKRQGAFFRDYGFWRTTLGVTLAIRDEPWPR